jgi:hypothetical protein
LKRSSRYRQLRKWLPACWRPDPSKMRDYNPSKMRDYNPSKMRGRRITIEE